MSSFIRKSAFGGSPADLGTRAGVHSQTLISTGLADLDRILGGGLPLGALLLVLEDAYSPHGSTLLQYFIAEGIACGHKVHWAAASTPEAKSLPSLAKIQAASQVFRSPSNLMAIKLIIGARLIFADSGCTMGAFWVQHLFMQEEEKELGKQEDPKLRIAWQYRRYIQRQQQDKGSQPSPTMAPTSWRKGASDFPGSAAEMTTAPHSRTGGASTSSAGTATSPGSHTTSKPKSASGMRDWCHQFDLTRPMDEFQLQNAHLECRGYKGSGALENLIEGTRTFTCTLEPSAQPLASHPAVSRGPDSIGRLAVEGLGSASWQLGMQTEQAVNDALRAVLHIKALVRASRCAACITIPAGVLWDSAAVRLQHMCDAVIALEAVRDDSGISRMVSDGSSCCGLLRVRRLPALNTFSRPLPAAELYVVRHRRRRLAIEQLQVDPDAEAAEAERASGKSSAAGLLCSGPPTATKALDF